MAERIPRVPSYELWIEAEVWDPADWTPADANTDVVVTFGDGSRWVATFFSYANVATLVGRYRQLGECLHGAYFWTSDMILVEEVSRPHIERVVAYLIEQDEFVGVFTRVQPDNHREDI